MLALRIHRNWCSTPFCSDVNADDWTDATLTIVEWHRWNDQRAGS